MFNQKNNCMMMVMMNAMMMPSSGQGIVHD